MQKGNTNKVHPNKSIQRDVEFEGSLQQVNSLVKPLVIKNNSYLNTFNT